MANDKIHGSGPPPTPLPPNDPLQQAHDALDADFKAANGSWREALARAPSGALLPVLDNIVQILRNDAAWHNVIAYDEFSGLVMKRAAPPFPRGEIGEWTDLDDARLELWLAHHYALRSVRSEALMKAVSLAADGNRYHAVREYLDGLKWDGTVRLLHMLGTYFGVAANPDYTQAVSVKWMVGAVARAYRPGCKMDNVLILEGDQGVMKSTALKVLFSPWFTDAAFDIGTPDGNAIIRGMWCVELAELDGYNRSDASRSKAFFTRTEDRYRNPYGRKPVNIPRQGVFAGSVNHSAYLKDESGNRRYWPVMTGVIEVDDLKRVRDQLWAEAVSEFRAGTEWWARASDRALFEVEQDERYIGDAYESMMRDWLDGHTETSIVRQPQATMADLLGKALHLDARAWTLGEQQRVGRIMARIARNPLDPNKPLWQRKRVGGESRERIWVRVEVVQS